MCLPLDDWRWKGRQMCPHLTDFVDFLEARAGCVKDSAMLGLSDLTHNRDVSAQVQKGSQILVGGSKVAQNQM